MNYWNEFLSSQDGRHSATEPAGVRDFGRVPGAAELAAGFVAAISDQGLIAVSGEDAASFLHKQLTNDIEHLGTGDIRLAGYCTPKGRLQASFLVWRDAATVYLQLPRELQAALQKRLSMFVLRDKAKLADITDSVAMIGFGGAAAAAVLEPMFGTLPAAPYVRIEHELGTLLRVADAFGAARYQWITSPEQAVEAWPQLAAKLSPCGNDGWRLAAIHAGVPDIMLRTQDQFVPQMINFELLGGVNFKKGCYPGQEIVARSQYLGKLKRRAALASVDADQVQAGDEVFAVADPDQPCGMIVNAAPNGQGGADVLVEIKLAALDDGDIRLGSAHGVPLRILPMPYLLDPLEL